MSNVQHTPLDQLAALRGGTLPVWASATRAAYRQCLRAGISRHATRAGLLAGLKRQGMHKAGLNRALARKVEAAIAKARGQA